MINVILFTKKSIFAVVLVSAVINPLVALPTKQNQTSKRSVQKLDLFKKIKAALQKKGLEESVATKKVQEFLDKNPNTSRKLAYLYGSSEILFSQENLTEALSQYALKEKKLDLNSYASLIGLSQSISLEPLNKNQLAYIEKISST